jgi:hypothetical protein
VVFSFYHIFIYFLLSFHAISFFAPSCAQPTYTVCLSIRPAVVAGAVHSQPSSCPTPRSGLCRVHTKFCASTTCLFRHCCRISLAVGPASQPYLFDSHISPLCPGTVMIISVSICTRRLKAKLSQQKVDAEDILFGEVAV